MDDFQSKLGRSRRFSGPLGFLIILLGLCVAGVVLVAVSVVLTLSIFFKFVVGALASTVRRGGFFFGLRRAKSSRVENMSAGFAQDDPAAKMDRLEALYRSGEISKSEYEERRSEVLDAL